MADVITPGSDGQMSRAAQPAETLHSDAEVEMRRDGEKIFWNETPFFFHYHSAEIRAAGRVATLLHSCSPLQRIIHVGFSSFHAHLLDVWLAAVGA